jgi:hypothetical protein
VGASRPDLQLSVGGEQVEDEAHQDIESPAGMVVFFSNMQLCTMRTAHKINVDRTFTTCPAPFKQLLFIQAKQAGKRAVPSGFCPPQTRYQVVLVCLC